MSFVIRHVAKCDVCGHEWLASTFRVPVRCAECKSDKWHDANPWEIRLAKRELKAAKAEAKGLPRPVYKIG